MKLICTQTQEKYPIDEIRWKSNTDALLDIEFRPKIDLDKIKQRPQTMWRYLESFPLVNSESIISFQEGFTPLVKEKIANQEVHLKVDYFFPTSSYKDRGTTIMMSHIKSLNIKNIVQDSSGNAGASVACYAGKAGIECDIFVPETTPQAKVNQILLYGAKAHKVAGSRQKTSEKTYQEALNSYYASHVWNPFFLHGTKTFAYEVCEQMNWQVPDTVVLPAGSGTLLLGAYIGFKELQENNIINKIPKIIGVQAENCAPLYQMFEHKIDKIPNIEVKPTLAEGISISKPLRAKQILDYVKNTQGKFLTVEEEEIKESFLEMAKKGYLIETTSAAVIAGLTKYINCFAEKDEKIASVLTGNGLKSMSKIEKVLEIKS